MTRTLRSAAGLAACAGPGPDPALAPGASACDPVLMIVSGVTLDAERMAAYQAALSASDLYPGAAGYYLNAPRPVAVFEGEVPDGFVSVIVRFPSLEAAETFWSDPLYQDVIKPMREDPAAGDYTVTVYREADLPGYMAGRVEQAGYRGCPDP
ncbi:MAG: DUF1330 domain-containing protein [Oceanicaulis sp.]